jgi:type II secretory pathway pseudopilin PulG
MRHVLVFVMGLLAGIAVAFVLWAIPARRHMANQFLLSALDQAYIAVQLQQGRAALVEPWIRITLPEYAEAIDRDAALRGHPIAADTLWMIRTYFEQGRHAPPARIQGILDTAPPDPPEACRRLLANMDRAAALVAEREDVTITLSPTNDPPPDNP